jgi:hypothetical protein
VSRPSYLAWHHSQGWRAIWRLLFSHWDVIELWVVEWPQPSRWIKLGHVSLFLDCARAQWGAICKICSAEHGSGGVLLPHRNKHQNCALIVTHFTLLRCSGARRVFRKYFWTSLSEFMSWNKFETLKRRRISTREHVRTRRSNNRRRRQHHKPTHHSHQHSNTGTNTSTHNSSPQSSTPQHTRVRLVCGVQTCFSMNFRVVSSDFGTMNRPQNNFFSKIFEFFSWKIVFFEGKSTIRKF